MSKLNTTWKKVHINLTFGKFWADIKKKTVSQYSQRYFCLSVDLVCILPRYFRAFWYSENSSGSLYRIVSCNLLLSPRFLTSWIRTTFRAVNTEMHHISKCQNFGREIRYRSSANRFTYLFCLVITYVLKHLHHTLNIFIPCFLDSFSRVSFWTCFNFKRTFSFLVSNIFGNQSFRIVYYLLFSKH